MLNEVSDYLSTTSAKEAKLVSLSLLDHWSEQGVGKEVKLVSLST
jgi:hypothetical protein